MCHWAQAAITGRTVVRRCAKNQALPNGVFELLNSGPIPLVRKTHGADNTGLTDLWVTVANSSSNARLWRRPYSAKTDFHTGFTTVLPGISLPVDHKR